MLTSRIILQLCEEKITTLDKIQVFCDDLESPKFSFESFANKIRTFTFDLIVTEPAKWCRIFRDLFLFKASFENIQKRSKWGRWKDQAGSSFMHHTVNMVKVNPDI